MRFVAITLAVAIVRVTPAVAQGSEQMRPPVRDVPGTADAPSLPRYRGAVLMESSVAEFDEVEIPRGPLVKVGRTDKQNNEVYADRTPLRVEGKRARLTYVLPAGRSPLEAVRGYQQAVREAGGQVVYECAGEACGGDVLYGSQRGGGNTGMVDALYPAADIKAKAFTAPWCVTNVVRGGQRYTALKLRSGAIAGILAFTVTDRCERLWNDRTVVIALLGEPAGREQRMEVVNADAMTSGLAAEGRVALYALFFDTGKSELKAESAPQLAEMGRFLKSKPALKVLVVGHTDNRGALDANLELSRRRAQAVVAALVSQQGIPAARLTAQGVGMAAPVATNASEAGRTKNRRVELVQQ